MKAAKKIAAALLCVCLLAGVCPGARAAEDMISATWVSYSANGTTVDTFMGVPAYYDYSGEWSCLEYIWRFYYEVYGLTPDFGSMVASGADGVFPLIKTDTPKPGDVLYSPAAKRGKDYDHFAIVKSYSNGVLTLIEQNWSSGGKAAVNRKTKFPSKYYDVYTRGTERLEYVGSKLADGTVELLNYVGVSGSELVVPATYNGLRVTKIGPFMFQTGNTSAATTLTISEGITEIVFNGLCGGSFDNITRINFPSTLKTIGNLACWEKLPKLTELRFPNSLTTIEAGAFNYQEALRDIYIPASVTKIGDGAFGPDWLAMKTDEEYRDSIRVQFPQYSGQQLESMVDRVIDMFKPEYTIHGVRGSCAEKYAAEYGVPFVELPFEYSDVASSAWYSEAVYYSREHGIFGGTSAAAFSPNTTLSRAMLVTVLWRLAGEPAAASSGFEDVSGDAWYANAVSWAKATGLVNGYSETSFGPLNAITRQQFLAVLYRYAALRGENTSARVPLPYSDAGSVAEWAADGASWAEAMGIIGEVASGGLQPAKGVSRAEAAYMLMMYMQ